MVNKECTFKELTYQSFVLFLDIMLSKASDFPEIQIGSQIVYDALNELDDPDRSILTDMYGLESNSILGVDTIAKKYNVSLGEVVSIKEKAFQYLRNKIKSEVK